MTTPAITKSPITKNPIYVGSRETSYVTSDCCTNCGNCATIPAKIKREIPFPILYSVISSPIHIIIILPAVTDKIVINHSKGLKTPISPPPPPPREKSIIVPNACRAAKGTVKNLVYWFIFALPASPPSLESSCNFGMSIVRS